MTDFNVIVFSFGQHSLLCDLKCYHPRRYRYERTRCVAITTNTARGAMIFLSGWFDLQFWTRPGAWADQNRFLGDRLRGVQERGCQTREIVVGNKNWECYWLIGVHCDSSAMACKRIDRVMV
jgi:hypothetical protein